MAKPRFNPTPEQRKIVRAMAGYGVPQEDIAVVVGIAPKTLRARFRNELDRAMIEANAKVAERLFRMTERNVAAAIFWMKSRASWAEKQDPQDINLHGDFGALSDAALERIARSGSRRGAAKSTADQG